MASGSLAGKGWLAFVLPLWFLLFRQVCGYWDLQPQYNFGWFVPMLAAYAWWNRWQTRPEPAPVSPAGNALGAFTFAAVLLLYGAVRAVQEANRDWQLVSWTLAALTVAATLVGVFRAGGFLWVRHFFFVTLFPLVSVPWPSSIEQPFILGLTEFVAMISAEVLTLADIPAIRNGNIIEVSKGPVGVEEACSGIQSFQSSVMMSLFLGEIFALAWPLRGVLFVGAIGWSFVCNLARTIYLGKAMYDGGPLAVEKMHDPAGYAAMAGGYAGIIVLALWLSRHAKLPKPVAPSQPPQSIPLAWAAAGLAALAITEAGTEWWYSRHESLSKGTTPPGWNIVNNSALPQAKPIDAPTAVRTVLRYDEATMLEWKSKEGHLWNFNALRWNPGNLAADNAGYHNPSICLVTAGLTLSNTYPQRTFKIAGSEVPFRMYRFDDGKGRTMFSFYSLWDPRDGFSQGRMPTKDSWTSMARIRNVIDGKRTAGLQVLNVSVRGDISFESAQREFQEILDKLAP